MKECHATIMDKSMGNRELKFHSFSNSRLCQEFDDKEKSKILTVKTALLRRYITTVCMYKLGDKGDYTGSY